MSLKMVVHKTGTVCYSFSPHKNKIWFKNCIAVSALGIVWTMWPALEGSTCTDTYSQESAFFSSKPTLYNHRARRPVLVKKMRRRQANYPSYSLINLIMVDDKMGPVHQYLAYCHKSGTIGLSIPIAAMLPSLNRLAWFLTTLAHSSMSSIFAFAFIDMLKNSTSLEAMFGNWN